MCRQARLQHRTPPLPPFNLQSADRQPFCSQINAKSVEADLYTSPNALRGWNLPEPDILVRTSGVSRLSDFLLWQVSFVPLVYTCRSTDSVRYR
jgi:undecaprenyl diphosphate synthase